MKLIVIALVILLLLITFIASKFSRISLPVLGGMSFVLVFLILRFLFNFELSGEEMGQVVAISSILTGILSNLLNKPESNELVFK